MSAHTEASRAHRSNTKQLQAQSSSRWRPYRTWRALAETAPHGKVRTWCSMWTRRSGPALWCCLLRRLSPWPPPNRSPWSVLANLREACYLTSTTITQHVHRTQCVEGTLSEKISPLMSLNVRLGMVRTDRANPIAHYIWQALKIEILVVHQREIS